MAPFLSVSPAVQHWPEGPSAQSVAPRAALLGLGITAWYRKISASEQWSPHGTQDPGDKHVQLRPWRARAGTWGVITLACVPTGREPALWRRHACSGLSLLCDDLLSPCLGKVRPASCYSLVRGLKLFRI